MCGLPPAICTVYLDRREGVVRVLNEKSFDVHAADASRVGCDVSQRSVAKRLHRSRARFAVVRRIVPDVLLLRMQQSCCDGKKKLRPRSELNWSSRVNNRFKSRLPLLVWL